MPPEFKFEIPKLVLKSMVDSEFVEFCLSDVENIVDYYKNKIEEENMNNNFTKKDLKPGNILVLRRGSKALWCAYKDKVIQLDTGHCICGTNRYDDNLLYIGGYISEPGYMSWPEVDIMEVYEDYTMKKLLWKRPVQILNDAERKYLTNVIKPFKDRVMYVKKLRNYSNNVELIVVRVRSILEPLEYEPIEFPFFEPDTMYKGMEVGRQYTLKELGLE